MLKWNNSPRFKNKDILEHNVVIVPYNVVFFWDVTKSTPGGSGSSREGTAHRGMVHYSTHRYTVQGRVERSFRPCGAYKAEVHCH